jgi:methyl-accepting chemotaxis protein
MLEDKRIRADGGPDDDLLNLVGTLADQVKILALNLAINLARTKAKAEELTVLEPQFTRLINGSVEAIRELSALLRNLDNRKEAKPKAEMNREKMKKIGDTLNEILDLSQNVHTSISEIKKKSGRVDKYK